MSKEQSLWVLEPLARTTLEGVWLNQLGSELVLRAGGAGALEGTFRSGTFPASATVEIRGSYDPKPKQAGIVLGFVVDWTEVHSVTVWSGQYHPADDTIRATWLMTTETDVGDDWRSTVIGHDVFVRKQPSGS